MMSSQSHHYDVATRIGIADVSLSQYHMPSINTIPYNKSNNIYHIHHKFMNDVFQKWERTLAQLYNANNTIRNLERIIQQGTESSSRESILLRREVVAVSRENLDLHDIIKQKDAEMLQLKYNMQYAESQHVQEITALNLTIHHLKEKYGEKSDMCEKLSVHLKRYENHNTPGHTTYNKEREELRNAECIRSGQHVQKRDTIGPPVGHDGHHISLDVSDTTLYTTHRCYKCNSNNLKRMTHISKCILDFEGNTRTISYVNHTGYSVTCDYNHISKPVFPGISYTAFGPEALKHILIYATRRSTDSDISHYFSCLYGRTVSHNSIWNARKALSLVLAPTIQYILEEFRKARFLQLDESIYRYRKRRIYVWVIRCDTATLIVPRLGRGTEDIYPYVKDVLDKPVVVDGYAVYPNLFRIIQRCWAHILRDAEDVCISDKKNPLYPELYHKLNNIFRKAKRVAKDAAKHGGAAMHTCNVLADEVRELAARYGNVQFAGTLANAADNLFTFLRYPGMPPTNNNSELDVRDYIIPQRNIRRKFMSEIGMAVFAILQSFAATCDKLNLDIGESFMNILVEPLHNIFDYVNTPAQEGGLSHILNGRPVLPMPVTTPALPKTITIPEASLPVLFSNTAYTVPAVPMMPPQNTTVIAPISTESNHTPHKEPIHDADDITLTHTIETSCVTPTRTCPISYDTKSDFVVSYTCVLVIPYGHDDYLLFHHKPPPFF